MPASELSMYHKDVVIDFFAYVMTQEQRQRLMREHPQAYNALYGARIVDVVRVDDEVPKTPA